MEDDMLTGTSDAAFRADRVLRCIDIIKEKIKELPILSVQEIEDNQKVVNAFDTRMKRMMCATYNNLEIYQLLRWKELFGLEEEEDGSNESI